MENFNGQAINDAQYTQIYEFISKYWPILSYYPGYDKIWDDIVSKRQMNSNIPNMTPITSIEGGDTDYEMKVDEGSSNDAQISTMTPAIVDPIQLDPTSDPYTSLIAGGWTFNKLNNITEDFKREQAQYFTKLDTLVINGAMKANARKSLKPLLESNQSKNNLKNRFNGLIELGKGITLRYSETYSPGYPYLYKPQNEFNERDKILMKNPILTALGALVPSEGYIDISMEDVFYPTIHLLPKKMDKPEIVQEYLKQPYKYLDDLDVEEYFPQEPNLKLSSVLEEKRDLVPWIIKYFNNHYLEQNGDPWLDRNILNYDILSNKNWRVNSLTSATKLPIYNHIVPNLVRDRVTLSEYTGYSWDSYDKPIKLEDENYEYLVTTFKKKVKTLRVPKTIVKYVKMDYTKEMLDMAIEEAIDDTPILELRHTHIFWPLVYIYKIAIGQDVSRMETIAKDNFSPRLWRLNVYFTPKKVILDIFKRMDNSFWGWPQLFPLIFNRQSGDSPEDCYIAAYSHKRQLAELFAKIYIFQGYIVNKRQWRVLEEDWADQNKEEIVKWGQSDSLTQLLLKMFNYGDDRATNSYFMGNVYMLHAAEFVASYDSPKTGNLIPPIETVRIGSGGKPLPALELALKNVPADKYPGYIDGNYLCWIIYPGRNSEILTAAIPAITLYFKDKKRANKLELDPCVAFPINEIEMSATVYDYSLTYEVFQELQVDEGLSDGGKPFPNAKNFLFNKLHNTLYGQFDLL